jgi:hypothetical protein
MHGRRSCRPAGDYLGVRISSAFHPQSLGITLEILDPSARVEDDDLFIGRNFI